MLNEFIPISGYEKYLISRDGRVLSTQKWNDGVCRELKQDRSRGGYCSVTLVSAGGGRKHFLVHRLVALTFLDPPIHPTHEVRHLDGNPFNNHVENLAWGSHTQNAQDAMSHNTTTRGSRNKFAKLTEDQVTEIKELLKTNRRRPGQNGSAGGKLTYHQIGIKYGVTSHAIANIATRSWKHV